MSNARISMTLLDLQRLLDQQKRLTIEQLVDSSHTYNKDNTNNSLKALEIDKEKFKQRGYTTPYPKDIQVLEKYLD